MSQSNLITLIIPTISDTMYQYSQYFGDDPRFNDKVLTLTIDQSLSIQELNTQINKLQPIVGVVNIVQRSKQITYPTTTTIYFYEADRWDEYCKDDVIIKDVITNINEQYYIGAVTKDSNSTKPDKHPLLAF